jgi:glycosyltransferase involved in cell wall biosynthesis
MTTLRYPEIHSRTAVWFWRYVQPFLIRHTDRVIAISQNVADDLAEWLDLPPRKVEVVYCAPKRIFETRPGADQVAAIRAKYGLPERYMLFVGLLAKKKNLPTLICALHQLVHRDAEVPSLVIAGRRYQQSDDVAIFDLIRALGLDEKVLYIGPPDDEDLPGLYGGAQLFVYPSLHEGFGIPCLEAMACGVPVVAARSGAVPEVVDNAAVLVGDPTNTSELAQAIHRACTDEPLRQELIARGFARMQLFSWPRLAEQVLELYRRTLAMQTPGR